MPELQKQTGNLQQPLNVSIFQWITVIEISIYISTKQSLWNEWTMNSKKTTTYWSTELYSYTEFCSLWTPRVWSSKVGRELFPPLKKKKKISKLKKDRNKELNHLNFLVVTSLVVSEWYDHFNNKGDPTDKWIVDPKAINGVLRLKT